jgi:hypothetical protein
MIYHVGSLTETNVALWWDDNNGAGCAYVGVGKVWEFSVSYVILL